MKPKINDLEKTILAENKKIDEKINLLNANKDKNIIRQKTIRKIALIINLLSIILISITIPSLIIINATISILTSLFSIIVLNGITTLIGYKKTKKIKDKINDLSSEIEYLENTKKQISNELKTSKDKKIDLNYINKKYNWRKQIKLNSNYIKYKNFYLKHFKKGDLYEVLLSNNYSNPDTYYIYNKTKEDFEEKEKQKVLEKNNK